MRTHLYNLLIACIKNLIFNAHLLIWSCASPAAHSHVASLIHATSPSRQCMCCIFPLSLMAAFCTLHDRTEGYLCLFLSLVPCQKPNGCCDVIVLEMHHDRQCAQHVQLGMYKLDLYKNRLIKCNIDPVWFLIP